MVKLLIVIPPYDFNDKQLVIITSILLKAGAQVMIANSTGQPAKGERGSIVTPNADFYHVSTIDFNGIIFIGGVGSVAYDHNRRALQLAKEFYDAGKVVAAIGLSPTILANAHILNGKRATARPTERDVINGVGLYTGAPVESDGNIITALSTGFSQEFTETILKALKR